MKIFFNLSFILSVLFAQVAYSLVLLDLELPDLVKIENNDIDGDGDIDDDDVEPIKLDCKYELDEDPSYLVVKWFINDINIYQWIRGKQPSVFPHFRHHIGDIEPTSSDKNHEYRGFNLINPSIGLSGTYKCLVQTDRGSKAIEKELHVVDISNSTYEFLRRPVENETYLECRVTNIFPQPKIDLVSVDDNLFLSGQDTQIKVLDNDYYEASVTAIAQNTDDDDFDDFSCLVTFDGLNLNVTDIMSELNS